MSILEIIKTRRSVRRFTADQVDAETVGSILEAARWAPSGLNNQPWKFAVIEDPGVKEQFASLTRYSTIVRSAPLLIAVFLDTEESYHRTKDIQAIGACIQNMLLEIHALGLGAVWLGEILKSEAEIRNILGTAAHLELMAVLAVGHPDEKPKTTRRKSLDSLIVCKK